MQFPTLDVVTVTTGRLVSDRGFKSLYEVCGYVLDDDALMTHQLPAASRAAEPHLVAQHPWLGKLAPPKDLDELRLWCDAIVREHGPELNVEPATNPDWLVGNALADLRDIAAGKPIIGVVVADRAR